MRCCYVRFEGGSGVIEIERLERMFWREYSTCVRYGYRACVVFRKLERGG